MTVAEPVDIFSVPVADVATNPEALDDRKRIMRDIKAGTLESLNYVAGLEDAGQMRALLKRLVSDLSSSMVKIELATPEPAGVVPAYDRETDGDYSAWLVSKNID